MSEYPSSNRNNASSEQAPANQSEQEPYEVLVEAVDGLRELYRARRAYDRLVAARNTRKARDNEFERLNGIIQNSQAAREGYVKREAEYVSTLLVAFTDQPSEIEGRFHNALFRMRALMGVEVSDKERDSVTLEQIIEAIMGESLAIRPHSAPA